MTGLRNSGNQVPNPDAVSQFNVVTNNYSAQLGKYSAARRQRRHQERYKQLPRFGVRVLSATGTSTRSAHNTGVGATKDPYNQHRSARRSVVRSATTRTSSSAASLDTASSPRPAHSGSLPSAAQIAGDFSENLPFRDRSITIRARQRSTATATNSANAPHSSSAIP